MNKKGLLISLEGIEGVGKSTALLFISAWLREKNIDFVLTREPGGTHIGESIRHILLKRDENPMAPETELLLMFAARAQHIAEVVRPALQSGRLVVSDRYTDASFAYQGGGRGVSLEFIQSLVNWVQNDCCPNLTILLDAPVSVGLERLKIRDKKDRIETETAAFFERVRQVYLDRAQAEPDRFVIISADQPLEIVREKIVKAIEELLT